MANSATKNKPDAPQGGAPAPSSNVLDRFNEELMANPGKMARNFVVVVGLGIAIYFGIQYWTDKAASSQDEAYRTVLEAGGSRSEYGWSGVELNLASEDRHAPQPGSEPIRGPRSLPKRLQEFIISLQILLLFEYYSISQSSDAKDFRKTNLGEEKT